MRINNQININQNGKTISLYSNRYGDPTMFGKKLIKLMNSKKLMGMSSEDVKNHLKAKYKLLKDEADTKKIDFVYNINLFNDQNTLVCEFNDPRKKQTYDIFGMAVDENWEEFDHYQLAGYPYMWD